MDNNRKAALAALDWYLDHGVDEALNDNPVKTKEQVVAFSEPAAAVPVFQPASPILPAAGSEARAEAAKLAAQAGTLEELREAIAQFEGIAIKKTATNLVFCDGNPKSTIMLIGEAPGADEDKQGKPFVGISGQLLDRILKWIDLDRHQDNPKRSIYISNILNWRPPGNRTPAPGEVEASLPFIEKHIALINPKLIVLCGGVSAKALLATDESISRLRKTWHTYKTISPDIGVSVSIPAIATYHPAYLLRTPSQKKAVWEDMLAIERKRAELGLK